MKAVTRRMVEADIRHAQTRLREARRDGDTKREREWAKLLASHKRRLRAA